MKKFIFILFALLFSIIETRASDEINFNSIIYLYPINLKPADLGIKGTISKITQKRWSAVMKFGEPTKNKVLEEEVFEYKNGLLISYLKKGDFFTSEEDDETKWVFTYTDDKKVREVYVKQKRSYGTFNSIFIYRYSNGKLESVDQRELPDNYNPISGYNKEGRRKGLSKITYLGNQTNIKKYDEDGKILQEFVYVSNKLVRIIDYAIIGGIRWIKDYNYNKLGYLTEETTKYNDGRIDKYYYKYNDRGWVAIWYDNTGWKTGFSYVVDKRGNWVQKIQSAGVNESFFLFEREIVYQ